MLGTCMQDIVQAISCVIYHTMRQTHAELKFLLLLWFCWHDHCMTDSISALAKPLLRSGKGEEVCNKVQRIIRGAAPPQILAMLEVCCAHTIEDERRRALPWLVAGLVTELAARLEGSLQQLL